MRLLGLKNRGKGRALVAAALACTLFSACGEDGGEATSATGTGGAGGGGGASCEPGAAEVCYSGTPGTEGVGICKTGTRTCNDQGTAFGPCLDDVTPREENCDSPDDDDCDGTVNEEIPGCCVPGVPVGCYSGPPVTKWVGICKAGTKVCNAQGTGFGPCEGEVLPGLETCETPEDDDCDGLVNEDVSACCEPGETAPCYSGPPGTEGQGICMGGIKTCDPMGG